jgi:hypothetical protein
MRKKNVQRAALIGKMLLGGALLVGLLIWEDNAQRLWRVMRTIRPGDIFLLLFVGLVMNVISCLKWRLFLRERGYRVSLLRLLSLYFIGKFFNNFMPSMIGGDLTRTYLLGRQINSQSQSFASVFLERLMGLIALIVLAIVFSLANPHLLSEPKIGIGIVSVSFGFVLFIGILLNRGFLDWARMKFGVIPFTRVIFDKIKKVQNDILYFQGKYKLLAGAVAYSFVFHFMTSVNVYVCCLAIRVQPSFLDIAVITPIILLLNIIPVSPNNIGWWEWTFSFFLVEAGTGSAEGLAVGLILRGMSLFFSLIGGAFFLFEKSNNKERASHCRKPDFLPDR